MCSGLNGEKGTRWENSTEAREENSFPSNKNSRSSQMGGGSPCGDHLFTLEGVKVAAGSWARRGAGGGAVPECQVDRVYTSHHYKREHLHMAGTSRT